MSPGKILFADRVLPHVRLELRRKLHPYTTLLELADDLDVTLPHLRRRLRELESRDDLSLENLVASVGRSRLTAPKEDLFRTFHQHHLCLVCGSPMEPVARQRAGWGEFEQCPFCLFSAHENSDFERQREVAQAKLNELEEAFREAKRIFEQRTLRGAALRSRAKSSPSVARLET